MTQMSKRESQQILTVARKLAREYESMKKVGIRPAIHDVYGDILNDDEALTGWLGDYGIEFIPASIERKQEDARLFSTDIKMQWFNAMTTQFRQIVGR